MPFEVVSEIPPGCERDVYEVLVTGFGPFQQHTENASWLAVQPLRGRLLRVDPEAYGYDPDPAPTSSPTAEPPKSRARYVRISTILVPMEYEEVLDVIPGLHARPPTLPDVDLGLQEEERELGEGKGRQNPNPPREGYDLMFHVGVTGRGALRMEKIAHKLGYNMKDRLGRYAPPVTTTRPFPGLLSGDTSAASSPANSPPSPDDDDDTTPPSPTSSSSSSSSAVDVHIGGDEGEAVASPAIAAEQAAAQRPTRGVVGYDTVTEELYTNIDVSTMIADLKAQGVTQIYSSMDAGHYLCDFLFYTSLAEARRKRTGSAKGRNAYQISKVYDTQNQGPHQPYLQIPVLCMHCPPVDKPLSSAEVTDAIMKMLCWVVAGM